MRYCFALLCILFPLLLFAQLTPSDVLVLDEYTPPPDSAEYIDEVYVREKQNQMCTYEAQLIEAKYKVYKLGGNILKITKLKPPAIMGSNCYRISGEAYYTDSLEAVRKQIAGIPDTISRILISDTAQYALLYVYRPATGIGWMHGNRLLLNDVEVSTLAAGSKRMFRIEKEGETVLHTDDDPVGEITLNIKFGKVYFVRCEVSYGLHMTLKKPNVGYREYMKMK
jgi:hypothetical protein